MQVLRIGDLVAHKHYPEKAIGYITEFYASGRVGVDDGYQRRSFLPKNLVVVKETQLSKELAKEITGSENTHKGWAEAKAAAIAAETAAAAAAIEKETNELIEMLEAELAAYESEVMEVPPVQVEEVENAIAQSEACPECNSYEEWVNGSTPAQAITTDEMIERPPTHPFSIFQKFDLVASLSEVIELPPVPRDFSKLKQMPEWWERPALPNMENPDSPIGDDEEDWEAENKPLPIKVKPETYAKLEKIAKAKGATIQEIIDDLADLLLDEIEAEPTPVTPEEQEKWEADLENLIAEKVRIDWEISDSNGTSYHTSYIHPLPRHKAGFRLGGDAQ